MPSVLLRPSILSAKNRLLRQQSDHPSAGQSMGITMAGTLLAVLVYWLVYTFLLHIQIEPELAGVLPAKIVHGYLLVFFFLLLFSNLVNAMGQIYGANDLPMILSSPASPGQLFLSRLLMIICQSSGVFLLFSLPCLLAYLVAFNLHWEFLLGSLLIGIPFLVIPGALGSLFATLIVCIFPTQRIKELAALLGVTSIFFLVAYGDHIPTIVGHETSAMSDAALYLALLDFPDFHWAPTSWAADTIVHLLNGNLAQTALPALLLTATALGLTCLSYLSFDLLFNRGWHLTMASRKPSRVGTNPIVEWAQSILFRLCPRLGAFALKDSRLFVRDTTQTLQMLLLLLLTLIYLYNFKALRNVSDFTNEGLSWWHAVLGVANLALGTCVISAICTRFVFPAVSLEGRAYWLLRVAPISIADFLKYKLIVSAAPISIVAMVLIVSGALAAQLPIKAVICSTFLAIVLSIGTVGLAIGLGAFFARFDWNSPTQIATSIGSLVYMFLSLTLVILSLVPAALLIVATCVESFAEQFSEADYALLIICAALLTIYINIATMRQAMNLGAHNLASLEA